MPGMIEKLPNALVYPFMRGEHVVYLQEGWWNGIWSDMSIESTYMKMGNGPSGIIGITSNERSVKIWANDHHLCGHLLAELETFRDNQRSDHPVHKEGAGRITSDAEGRRKISMVLSKCNGGCQNEFSTGSNEEERGEVEYTSGDEDGKED